MNHYQRGYLDGWRERRAQPGATASNQLADQEAERLTLAEMVGSRAIDPEAESDYWLGYYHGRRHRREGAPAAAAIARDQIPPGL